jgi:hypothetical protein
MCPDDLFASRHRNLLAKSPNLRSSVQVVDATNRMRAGLAQHTDRRERTLAMTRMAVQLEWEYDMTTVGLLQRTSIQWDHLDSKVLAAWDGPAVMVPASMSRTGIETQIANYDNLDGVRLSQLREYPAQPIELRSWLSITAYFEPLQTIIIGLE